MMTADDDVDEMRNKQHTHTYTIHHIQNPIELNAEENEWETGKYKSQAGDKQNVAF